MSSSVTVPHASVTHMFYLVNLNHSEKCHLQTRQDAVDQNQLRHSRTFSVTMLAAIKRFSADFLAFNFYMIKSEKYKYIE